MKQSEANAFLSDIFALLTVEVGTPLGVLIPPPPSLPALFNWASQGIFIPRRVTWGYCMSVHTQIHAPAYTHFYLSLSPILAMGKKKMQACCSPKNKTNLKKVYWLHCSRVILIPKTKNEKKRNIFSRERSLEWVKTQLGSFHLTLSEWCDLGWDISSLETLVSVIVICSVWTSSSLRVFSSLKVYGWHQC